MNLQTLQTIERTIVKAMFAAGIEEIVPTAIKYHLNENQPAVKVEIQYTDNRYGHELISNYKLKISQLAMFIITTKLVRPQYNALLNLLVNAVERHPTDFYNTVSQYGNSTGSIQTHFTARIVHNTIRTINEHIKAIPAAIDVNDLGENAIIQRRKRFVVKQAMATMIFDMDKYFIVPVYHNFLFGIFKRYQLYAQFLFFNGGRYTENIADLIIFAVNNIGYTNDVLKSNTMETTTVYKWTPATHEAGIKDVIKEDIQYLQVRIAELNELKELNKEANPKETKTTRVNINKQIEQTNDHIIAKLETLMKQSQSPELRMAPVDLQLLSDIGGISKDTRLGKFLDKFQQGGKKWQPEELFAQLRL